MNATDLPGLRLSDQLCFPIYAASNLMQRLYRPLLDALGLTYPQYLVMLALWESEPLAVSEIGARLYLDSGTLTPLLKRLESSELVTRQRDPADERRVLVSLTPAGRKLRHRAKAIPGSLLCQVDLPAAQLIQLRDDMRALMGAIETALPD